MTDMFDTDWFDTDQDDDVLWYTPPPDGARHAMPSLEGPVPCCGRDPLSLPAGDWTTSDPHRVTCTGAAA